MKNWRKFRRGDACQARPQNHLLRIVACLLAALASRSLARAAEPRADALTNRPPNIMILLADDQGWGDLSVTGNTNLATPHIDALAKSGAQLERFFVCPVCSPTRAEMLTGRYHPRGGVHGVSTGGERLNLDERTIAQVFHEAGYATGCFGKWHNGTQYPYHPNARGFDEYYGFTSGHWGIYFDPPLDHNGQIVQGKGFLADDLTDHAMTFLADNQQRNKPSFCYLAFNTPHTPAQVPDAFFSRFAQSDLKLLGGKGESVPKTRAVLAMCENLDYNVGRVLAKLDELKLADETIVIYFSDNGPNGIRWNGGMRGIKGSTDEGGVRSPFFIRWPGHIRGGLNVPQIAAAIDLLPTLADLTHVATKPSKPLDGVSLKPLLLEEKDDWPERMIFSHWSGKVSVRTQQYRLDATGRLYDMPADPGQQTNIADKSPDVANKLRAAVAAWKSDVFAGQTRDDRPFPVGYTQLPLTMLPARDGVGHGNVRRSAQAPNCSYFEHWTATSDQIEWDVEVATPGRYEVELWYTCAAADVGSTIEISMNGAALRTKISQANDPPLRGKEHDRVPREESYVKDFKPLQMGTFELKAGRGTLTLKALQITGQHVADVRMVTLKLLSGD